MGLTAEITAAIGAAFDGDLSDAVSDFTLYKVATAAYVPANGVQATEVAHKSRGVFDAPTKKNTFGYNISTDTLDSVLTVLQADLSILPEISDKVYLASAGWFSITSIASDAAHATYTIYLTRSGQ